MFNRDDHQGDLGQNGSDTQRVRVFGIVGGDDGNGYELQRALAATGVVIAPLSASRERFTPTYIKPRRDGRELNRLDVKNRVLLPAEIESAVIARLRDLLPRVDGVIAVDQVQESNGGVITDCVRTEIAARAREHPQKNSSPHRASA